MRNIKNDLKRIPYACLVLLLATAARAKELSGVVFEESVSQAGKTLTLNGTGLRKYMFYKVYAAGLYLTDKSKSEREILSSAQIKAVRLHYFRSIAKEDMKKAWAHSIGEACPGECLNFKDALAKFYDAVEAVKENGEQWYFMAPAYLEIRSGNKTQRIEHAEFSNMILKTWIGDHPPTESLKQGLLGL